MGSNIVALILGVFIILMGIANCMGHIETIHSYNRRKVAECDRKPYGKAVGTGTIIIGASISMSMILDCIFKNEWVYSLVVAGCVVGLIFILYGQFKYNKGLF